MTWTPVRVKFFDIRKGWGFLTTKEGKELFFLATDLKDAGIMWLPAGKQIWALYREDKKGCRVTKLSFLRPENLNETPSERPQAVSP